MNGATVQQDASIKLLKDTLKEFSTLSSRLNAVTRIDRKSLKFRKKDVPKKGREETRLFFRDVIDKACGMVISEEVRKLVRLTHESYERFKRVLELRDSTHCYITDRALGLLNIPPAAAGLLLEYCKFPDDPQSDMQDLIFEGHFFGETKAGGKGNFLENAAPTTVLILKCMKRATNGLGEDIHEHALMNFVNHCNLAVGVSGNVTSLGVAAHYLQDLTAPHHVGNYPAVPYVDHFFFEKYANKYVYDSPDFVLTPGGYIEFKSSLRAAPTDPQAFALEIYERARAFIPCIETDLHAEVPGTEEYALKVDSAVDEYNQSLVAGNRKWKEAVDHAIPLAVYASAFLFETVLEAK